MKLPHFPNFKLLADQFFLRALRKYGLINQVLKASTATCRLQIVLNAITSGDRSLDRETELIEAIAEMEIYLSALGNALQAESEIKQAIHTRLEQLRSDALDKS